jgi:DNA-binding IclR family transcriptional regulator
MSQDDPRRRLGSVGNALRLIEALALTPESGVSSLARSLGVSTTTVDRLLNTLAAAGYVEQNPVSRRYRLTLKLSVLGARVRSRLDVIDVARPHMEALAARVHEGVNLGVLADHALVYADSIPTEHLFRIEARPGTALPAHCTAAGKTLLAYQPTPALDAFMRRAPFERYTDTTVTEPDALLAELDRIRADGFALDQGELLEESWCAAAPVLGANGAPLAAISVTSVRSRFLRKREEIVAAVRETAQTVSDEVTAGPR